VNIENRSDGPAANGPQGSPTAFVSSAPLAPADGPWPDGLEPAPLQGPVSPDSSVPFRSVGFTISTAGYAIARRFKAILAPLDLEPREFALLRAVAASEGQSQHSVGARLQIPPSRMVAFVDALEQRGLLERRQNPSDRRSHALYLTDAGHDMLARAFTLAVEHERDLCADLDVDEREQLLELLQRVGLRLGLDPGVHSALADE
jgi:DNA-binding MarR family transcriptional regulator